MTQDGEIDEKAMSSSVDRLVRNGVAGVIVLPMLGENSSLTVAEREKVIRLAKEVAGGRVPVLSGWQKLHCRRLRKMLQRIGPSEPRA